MDSADPADGDLADARDALAAADPDRRREGARRLFVGSRAHSAGAAHAAPALRDRMDDDDPTVRGHALATLWYLAARSPIDDEDGDGEPVVVDPPDERLVAALSDPDPGVRGTAVGLLSDPASTPPEGLRPDAAAGLVALLNDDGDLVRLRAAETISASAVAVHPDPDAAVDALLAALEDDRTDVRTNVGETVVGLAIDHPDLLAGREGRLRELLEADHADVRVTAGFALAALDRDDEVALRAAVDAMCDLVPVEERWAGTYWMRTLLQQWIQGRPGVVATAIEDHGDPPEELATLARRIRRSTRHTDGHE